MVDRKQEEIKSFWEGFVTGDIVDDVKQGRIEIEPFHDGMEAQELLDSDKVKIDKSVFLALGNGDVEKGIEFLYRFASGVYRARGLHTAEEWQDYGGMRCTEWLSQEVRELDDEIYCAPNIPSSIRIEEESLDVMIVALRIFNKEWQANEKPDSAV